MAVRYKMQISDIVLQRGVPWAANDISYPANWLDLANDDDLAAHGIIKEVEPDPPNPPLDGIKSELKAKIDADAEGCRLRYISPGSGQAMTYLEKHNQAVAVHEMGETAANALSENDRKATFPTLAASVGVEADTLWECSQIVLARYLAFVNISHDIERIKLVNKKLISLASDAAAARAAYEAITWPNP